MTSDASFLDWLRVFGRDLFGELDPDAPQTEPDKIEEFLWRLEHGFLHGNDAVAGPLAPYGDLVQYLSLPLYSHVKEQRNPKKPWLTCYPLFVGTGNVDGDAPVAARYLRLYHALNSNLIKFSFTGFAGNAELGLDAIPRFLLLSTDDGEFSFEIDSDETGGSLHVKASLPALQITDPDPAPPADFFPSARSFAPFVEKNVDERTIRGWWEPWSKAAGTLETSTDVDEVLAKHAAGAENVIARLVTDSLEPLLKRGDGDARARHQRLAEGLIRFLAWNHALGFRRIVYLPFASASPAGITWKPASWGGLIAVLRRDAPLEDLFASLKGDTTATALAAGIGGDLSRYVSFSMLCRAFVDLAVARVVAFDWAKYTREVKRPHLRRTARAAIMSRNLSHNIGSHALANAHLFEAVGVLNLESVPPKEDGRPCLHGSKPPSRKLTSAVDITLKDGFPTSLKSAYPVSKGEVWRARNRLGALNSYLQGRMDFIARALGESASHPEPMYFVAELVRPFLSQTVLLNTLLSDHGFTCEKMEFHVHLPGSEKPLVFRRSPPAHGDGPGAPEDHELRHAECPLDPASSGDGSQDVLVGVPGGMVGRHAFYAFLENVMRNAAKYGPEADAVAKDTERRFVIRLSLTDRNDAIRLDRDGNPVGPAEPCYQLTVTDNLSLVDSELDLTRKPLPVPIRVRSHLAKDVIDKNERIQTEGHGIQEMKLCAHFLAGGDSGAVVFPDDESCLACPNASDDYHSFLSKLGASPGYTDSKERERQPAWIRAEARGSLRCFTTTCPDPTKPATEPPCPEHAHLAYALILQQPTLLGVVRPGPGDGAKDSTVRLTEGRIVMRFDSIERLASEPAYFGLLIAPDMADSESFLSQVSHLHAALPFRLMVGVREEEERVAWIDAINSWQGEHANAWWEGPAIDVDRRAVPFPLPTRRLHVVRVPELLDFVTDGQTHDLKTWRQELNRLYDRWLLAYKGTELDRAYPNGDDKRWHLLLGFDRPVNDVLAKWGLPAPLPQAPAPACVQVHLFGRGPDGSRQRIGLEQDAGPLRAFGQPGQTISSELRGAVLALDNHGSAFPVDESASTVTGQAAYHPFSGSEQVALFQLLETPPADPDARQFLIYSVVESLLTRVVVVDERVAEATVQAFDDGKTLMGDRAAAFARARVHPIYSVWTETEGVDGSHPQQELFLPSVVLEEPLRNDQTMSGGGDVSEGLRVSPINRERNSCCLRFLARTGALQIALMDSDEFPPDVLVLHEGVVDKIHDAGGWPESLHHQLFALCPWVVRTSGRGANARHLGMELPFLEFSELSDATYRQMNKVALGKALLSLRGLTPKQPG